MNETTIQPEPKHYGVLKAGLLFLGVVVVGAVMLVVYKGDGVRQTTEPAAFFGLTGQSPASETINGIVVPPEPDPAVNNATLAGVDSNNNGVRDDVERFIAKKSASVDEFNIRLIGASFYQEILTLAIISQNEYDAGFLRMTCADEKIIDIGSFNSDDVRDMTFNTDARRSDYKSKTFKIRGRATFTSVECSEGFKSTSVSETINGITVPPEPDPAVNNATLAGVDSNNNGVRDDVERVIAKQFGGTSDYPFALAYAQEYQKIIISPTPATRAGAITSYSKVLCTVPATAGASLRTLKIDVITANTRTREQALQAFNDVLIGYIPEELQPCADDHVSETINGITVPPEPDPAVNNATLAGVDSNNNGVRDDVERVIAGASKKTTYEVATLEIGKLYNQLSTVKMSSPEVIAETENKIYCLEKRRSPSEQQTISAEDIKMMTNNTAERTAVSNANDTLLATKPSLVEGGFLCK